MGALKGTMTVRRYVVRGGEPPKDRQRIMRGIRTHVFLPIDPQTDVEKSVGWACLENPTNCDPTTADVFTGDAIGLTLRVDTLKAPAAVVKRLVAEKLQGLDHKPTRGEKQAAKEEVKRSLRKRYYPTTRAIEVVWFPDAGKVYFWSHAKAANELLVDLFKHSFGGLELVPEGPGIIADKAPLLVPTPEMVGGFPGLPGRAVVEDTDEDAEEDDVG